MFYGVRKKALLAFCLAFKDDLIILDEPTTNLDFKNRTIFFEILKEKISENKTIILTTNDMNEEYIILSDYILSLENKDIKKIQKKRTKIYLCY